MKILYVISRPLEINTSASIRNRATIEGLLELGHNVDLITTQFDTNHSNYENYAINKDLNVRYLQLGGIQRIAKISRNYKFVRPLKQLAYRVISKFEIYDNLKDIASYATKMNINDDKYDVIISSSDPKSSHLFVSRMFENGVINTTPWIQIWGDPYLSDATRNNILLNFRIKNEENRLLKYASKIIYVSSLTLEEQQKIYSHYATKMFYIPIPYVKKDIYPTSENDKESLYFLYCGDYSSNIRDIRPLYEAIKNTQHKLVVCGDSNVKLDSTERIKIYPRVSYEKTKEFESKCDVLVHLSNLKGTQIPGKIYQYSGTNKSILFILDGCKEQLKEAFEKYRRYIFCENNVQSITRTLINIHECKSKVLNYPIEEFSGLNIVKNILYFGK